MFTNRSKPQNVDTHQDRPQGSDGNARTVPIIASLYQEDIALILLLANRSFLIGRIKRCRSALTPYSKLPPGLIRIIILLCLPENIHHLPSFSGSKDFRLQITQICLSWRKVAFSMPELWEIELSDNSRAHASSMSLANAWFPQSSASHFGLTVLHGWAREVP